MWTEANLIKHNWIDYGLEDKTYYSAKEISMYSWIANKTVYLRLEKAKKNNIKVSTIIQKTWTKNEQRFLREDFKELFPKKEIRLRERIIKGYMSVKADMQPFFMSLCFCIYINNGTRYFAKQ
mgnify:CR=1 FL=1